MGYIKSLRKKSRSIPIWSCPVTGMTSRHNAQPEPPSRLGTRHPFSLILESEGYIRVALSIIVTRSKVTIERWQLKSCGSCIMAHRICVGIFIIVDHPWLFLCKDIDTKPVALLFPLSFVRLSAAYVVGDQSTQVSLAKRLRSEWRSANDTPASRHVDAFWCLSYCMDQRHRPRHRDWSSSSSCG